MEWRDIASAPQDAVILVHDEGYVGKALWDAEALKWLDCECQHIAHFDPPPTEWMPLPDAPEAK